jgi:hypothetical protein
MSEPRDNGQHTIGNQTAAPGMDKPDDLAKFLPRVLVAFMRDIGIPNAGGAQTLTDGDATRWPRRGRGLPT